MKKYVNLICLSRSVFRKALTNEVRPLSIPNSLRYSTSVETVGPKESASKSPELMPELIDSNELDEFGDISYRDIEKNVKVPHALDECDEDLSYLARYHRPTFNFALYANKSETIQELVKLGVELWKVEGRPEAMLRIMSSKFEDLKVYIQFLHDCGVPPEEIGNTITKNPMIFTEDMDDLKTRIRYLRAHNFSKNDIARIVTVNPVWLSWTTQEIDRKLGFFQREFKLNGRQIRDLAVKRPQLITWPLEKIRDNTFSIREEMGFDDDQIRTILLDKPQIWQRLRAANLLSFNYVHLDMGIPHEVIAKQSCIIATRLERIRNRHLFLVKLKRNQYDPKKPLYVPLESISMLSDIDFCIKVAKCSVELYDRFLKTL